MHLFSQATGGEYIYLVLYIDDMLIASTNRSSIDKLRVRLLSKFEMKDLGEAKRILGVEIERDRVKGKVSLTQKAYLQKVLQKFYIGCEANSESSPLAPHSSFQLICFRRLLISVSICLMFHTPVQWVSLNYVMVCTRPNLSQAIKIYT